MCHRDLLLLKPGCQLSGRLNIRLRWNAKRGPQPERRENISQQRIMRQAGEHAETLTGCEVKRAAMPLQKMRERSVIAENALRPASRTGRKRYIGQLIGLDD